MSNCSVLYATNPIWSTLQMSKALRLHILRTYPTSARGCVQLPPLSSQHKHINYTRVSFSYLLTIIIHFSLTITHLSRTHSHPPTTVHFYDRFQTFAIQTFIFVSACQPVFCDYPFQLALLKRNLSLKICSNNYLFISENKLTFIILPGKSASGSR